AEQWKYCEKILQVPKSALFLKCFYEKIRKFQSYDVIDSENLKRLIQNPKISTIIKQLFEELQEKHGEYLVIAALSYITLSRHGLSETELEDIMSLDDQLLNNVYQFHIPPVRRIPGVLSKRIFYDLKEYITEREADNVKVINWTHMQFRSTILSTFAKNITRREGFHKNMADYFTGVWAGLEKPFRYTPEQIQRFELVDKDYKAYRTVPDQPNCYIKSFKSNIFSESATDIKEAKPNFKENSKNKPRFNLRKLSELSMHLLGSKNYSNLDELVIFNLPFLFSKLIAVSLGSLILDLNEIIMRESIDKNPEKVVNIKSIICLKNALQLSSYALSVNSFDIVPHLTGRLLPYYFDDDNMRYLIEQCDSVIGVSINALVPIYQYLNSPGGPIQYSFDQHKFCPSGIYVINNTQHDYQFSHLITVSDIMYVYDLLTGEVLREVPFNIKPSIVENVICQPNENYLFSYSNFNHLIVTNLKTYRNEYLAYEIANESIKGSVMNNDVIVVWSYTQWTIYEIKNDFKIVLNGNIDTSKHAAILEIILHSKDGLIYSSIACLDYIDFQDNYEKMAAHCINSYAHQVHFISLYSIINENGRSSQSSNFFSIKSEDCKSESSENYDNNSLIILNNYCLSIVSSSNNIFHLIIFCCYKDSNHDIFTTSYFIKPKNYSFGKRRKLYENDEPILAMKLSQEKNLLVCSMECCFYIFSVFNAESIHNEILITLLLCCKLPTNIRNIKNRKLIKNIGFNLTYHYFIANYKNIVYVWKIYKFVKVVLSKSKKITEKSVDGYKSHYEQSISSRFSNHTKSSEKMKSREPCLILNYHHGWITKLIMAHFTSDLMSMDKFVTVSYDNSVKVWNLDSIFDRIPEVSQMSDVIQSIYVPRNLIDCKNMEFYNTENKNSEIFAFTHTKRTIAMWDLRNGDIIRKFIPTVSRLDETNFVTIRNISVSFNSKIILSAEKNAISLWNTISGKCLNKTEIYQVEQAIMMESTKLLACIVFHGKNTTLRLHDKNIVSRTTTYMSDISQDSLQIKEMSFTCYCIERESYYNPNKMAKSINKSGLKYSVGGAADKLSKKYYDGTETNCKIVTNIVYSVDFYVKRFKNALLINNSMYIILSVFQDDTEAMHLYHASTASHLKTIKLPNFSRYRLVSIESRKLQVGVIDETNAIDTRYSQIWDVVKGILIADKIENWNGNCSPNGKYFVIAPISGGLKLVQLQKKHKKTKKMSTKSMDSLLGKESIQTPILEVNNNSTLIIIEPCLAGFHKNVTLFVNQGKNICYYNFTTKKLSVYRIHDLKCIGSLVFRSKVKDIKRISNSENCNGIVIAFENRLAAMLVCNNELNWSETINTHVDYQYFRNKEDISSDNSSFVNKISCLPSRKLKNTKIVCGALYFIGSCVTSEAFGFGLFNSLLTICLSLVVVYIYYKGVSLPGPADMRKYMDLICNTLIFFFVTIDVAIQFKAGHNSIGAGVFGLSVVVSTLATIVLIFIRPFNSESYKVNEVAAPPGIP
ncbi:hypothetical protein A3Q56_05973, partial [Intoshia linei]